MFITKRKALLDKKTLGKWGEKCCEKFLKGKGMHTLARNFSCKTGEIDLIMVDTNHTIVFVEVKTRTALDFSQPEDAVTVSKQQKSARAAKYFLVSNNIENRPYRFDVVAITLEKDQSENISHYKNAFVA